MLQRMVITLLFCSLCASNVLATEMMSVSFSGADIRTSPSAAMSKVVFTASRYYPLEVVGKDKEYYKVKDHNGRIGYIHKTLLNDDKTIVVTADKANLRKGPGTDNDVVGQLSKNDGAKFVSKTEGWVEIVTANGERGWIADFLIWGE